MKDNPGFRLLHYWSYKKVPLGSGLTIPFIIGALNKNPNNNNDYSIRRLIHDFATVELGTYNVSIRYCSTIGALVCCLEQITEGELIGVPKLGNLYLFAEILIKFDDINVLTKYLEKEFNDLITKSFYSIDNGKWHEFNDFDKVTKKQAVANKM